MNITDQCLFSSNSTHTIGAGDIFIVPGAAGDLRALGTLTIPFPMARNPYHSLLSLLRLAEVMHGQPFMLRDKRRLLTCFFLAASGRRYAAKFWIGKRL